LKKVLLLIISILFSTFVFAKSKSNHKWKLEVLNSKTREEKYYAPGIESLKVSLDKTISCVVESVDSSNGRRLICVEANKIIPTMFSASYVVCGSRNDITVQHLLRSTSKGSNFVVSLECN